MGWQSNRMVQVCRQSIASTNMIENEHQTTRSCSTALFDVHQLSSVQLHWRFCCCCGMGSVAVQNVSWKRQREKGSLRSSDLQGPSMMLVPLPLLGWKLSTLIRSLCLNLKESITTRTESLPKPGWKEILAEMGMFFPSKCTYETKEQRSILFERQNNHNKALVFLNEITKNVHTSKEKRMLP